MRPCWPGMLKPYSSTIFPFWKKENCAASSCLKFCSIVSGQKQRHSDTTCNHSHTRSGSVWGFLRFYLRVGDEHLFQIVWGWTPSVVPATSCFWGCSRSRSSCGCCSETHRCDTTVHTEHTHKQMQLWVFKKWKIIRTMQKQNLK